MPIINEVIDVEDPIYFLERVRQFMVKNRLSSPAKKRLIKDLEAICVRLEKREYETSGIVENVFDVPDKTKQFYAHLSTYATVGRTWSRILKFLPIIKQREIVDLCPGFTPKVELALFYLGFQGKVILLDKNRESVLRAEEFINLFNPNFTIKSVIIDLFVPFKMKYFFVIGNHVIDDLILNYFTDKYQTDMAGIYDNESGLLNLWDKILKNEEENMAIISQKLESIFTNLLHKDGYLCLAQYRSYLEKMLSLDKSFKFTNKVFLKVIGQLSKNGFKKVNINFTAIHNKNNYFSVGDCAILRKVI